MKYIYDILLNFSETRVYEFYEWNPDDDIEYFKKVPIIRINEEEYSHVAIGNKLEDQTFLDSIYNATEIYQNKAIKHVDYSCIITNGKEALAVLFDKHGEIIMISKMLIDEEEEVLDLSGTLPEKKLTILTANKQLRNHNSFLTRLEDKKRSFLNKEIDELYDNKHLLKLKYLYYECSNNIEENIDIIYKKIKQFLNGEWSNRHDDLYNLVRLSYSKK